MTGKLKTVSPVDGSVYVERPYAAPEDIAQALTRAVRAGKVWRDVPVAERAEGCARATPKAGAAFRPMSAFETLRVKATPAAQPARSPDPAISTPTFW